MYILVITGYDAERAESIVSEAMTIRAKSAMSSRGEWGKGKAYQLIAN